MPAGSRRPTPPDAARQRWRLQERFEASAPQRRWFVTLAGLIAVVSLWRGTWLLMDLYVFPSSPAVSAVVSIGLGIVLLLAAGWSLEDIA